MKKLYVYALFIALIVGCTDVTHLQSINNDVANRTIADNSMSCSTQPSSSPQKQHNSKAVQTEQTQSIKSLSSTTERINGVSADGVRSHCRILCETETTSYTIFSYLLARRANVDETYSFIRSGLYDEKKVPENGISFLFHVSDDNDIELRINQDGSFDFSGTHYESENLKNDTLLICDDGTILIHGFISNFK